MPKSESESADITSGLPTLAISSFPHLCWLTKLLGDLLPMIYSLRKNDQEAWKTIRRTECALDDWLDTLPDSLNVTKRNPSRDPSLPEASGLWFYYLSLKLVLNRLAYKVMLRNAISPQTLTPSQVTASGNAESQKELQDYRLALLQKSALSVVEYIASLQEEQFREFWLPCELLCAGSQT